MTDWNTIAVVIGTATRQPFQFAGHTSVSGGCINQTSRIVGKDGRNFFVKLNSADRIAMFTAEVAGLGEIAATHTVRVPKPIAYGIAGKQSYLVLEYLELTSHGNAHLLGKQLAALHRVHSNQFGFARDNFIGATPQQNGWPNKSNADWIEFWREHRLGFQLRLADQNGFGSQLRILGEKLMDALPAFFKDYTPQPSLLHGDLWSGNHAYLQDGMPTIFDPAAYYGDRECDLAMTELFGGYSGDFYTAYRAAYPLDAGYATRKTLYNLYHILNHANLFGGSYVRQAQGMMQQLLAKVS